MICRNCCEAVDDGLETCPLCGMPTGYYELRSGIDYEITSTDVSYDKSGREKKTVTVKPNRNTARELKEMYVKPLGRVRTLIILIIIFVICGILPAILYSWYYVLSNIIYKALEGKSETELKGTELGHKLGVMNTVANLFLALTAVSCMMSIVFKFIMGI